jgi:phosphoadenosine phosphosulfate reductase
MTLIDYGLIYDFNINSLKFGKINKVAQAIERLKMYEPREGYFLAFSGGKDSVVLRRLADMAGVKYEPHYHITTIDPPQLTRFINRSHADVIRDRPNINMWDLMIKKKLPPLKQLRYCCAELKETKGKGWVVLTGVRWAESSNRKRNQGIAVICSKKKENKIIFNEDNDESRRSVEQCYRTQKTMVNPIIDWLDEDIWEFIKYENVPYCELYDEGFVRLGCIGCPFASQKVRAREFERWPWYKDKYIRTFDRIVELRQEQNKPCCKAFSNGEDMFNWWTLEPENKPYEPGLFGIDEGQAY